MIDERLALMFPNDPDTMRYERLQKLTGLAKETIRRFMKGETSMTLRNLVIIAEAVSLTLPAMFGGIQDAGRMDARSDSEQSVTLHRRRN